VLIKEKNETLLRTVEAARTFITLGNHQQVLSDWYKSIVEAREARSYFRGNPLRASYAFGVHVAFQMAMAYIECAAIKSYISPPSKKDMTALQTCAGQLSRHIDRASWVIPQARNSAFQTTLKTLKESPSQIEPRGPGRVAMVHRQRFVKTAAANLYSIDSRIHVGLITAATALAWEDISELQVREILTAEVRTNIAEAYALVHAWVKTAQEAGAANTFEAHLMRVKSIKMKETSVPGSNRSDGDKINEAISLLGTLINSYAAGEIVNSIESIAREHGIER